MTAVQRRALDTSGGERGERNNEADAGRVCCLGQVFDVWFNAERERYDLDMAYGYPPVVDSSYEEAFHLGEEATRHRSGGRHYPRGYENTAEEQRRVYRSEVEVSFSIPTPPFPPPNTHAHTHTHIHAHPPQRVCNVQRTSSEC